ncbi:MAG TPA: cryptochrome/photolyase family protein [Bacteroidetes bacterium]|nr:cryptochrome/photolyase family protein [Bacteroidota bacterium]
MEVRLILGDQLNENHSWFSSVDASVVYVMMEVRSETDYVRHHAQKVIAIFAAMRRFAEALRDKGHTVEYVKITDPLNRHDLVGNVQRYIERYCATSFAYQEPDEYRVDQVLLSASRVIGIDCRCVSSEHFLTERHQAAEFFGSSKRWLMERFYRMMRKRHRILLTEDGEPLGGEWNFDVENRGTWKGAPAEPADQRPHHDHTALWQEIVDAGVVTMGEPHADDIRWPIDRREALQQLDDFLVTGLRHFGTYQDAMHHDARRLFHSLLSFALNVKMITPLEVIRRVEEEYRRGGIEINHVEGFIRQILGWREYVRGVYWARMPGYDEQNFFGHAEPLPDWFWTGRTDMRCLSLAIGQSLDMAYAHHIQRLMIIGNYALLAGLDPKEVHTWYLGVYIDAFEWVELPNTLGMSQYADGGFLATKPYVSSAAYISRMSDSCKGCAFDAKKKTGPGACPFNAMYWDFFRRNQDVLRSNPRLGIVYRQLDRTA